MAEDKKDPGKFEPVLPEDEAFKPMLEDPGVRGMAESIVELQKQINALEQKFEASVLESAGAHVVMRDTWKLLAEKLDGLDLSSELVTEINQHFRSLEELFTQIADIYATMQGKRQERTAIALEMEDEVEGRGMGTVWVV